MKTILTLAAMTAALAGASAASAHDNGSGHWEWRNQPSAGPRSTMPSRTRVWVKDGGTAMADCNCAMMKMSPADCMMDMPGKRAVPSAG